ncbi:MAG: HAD family hydrolase [Acidobacteria bacterium]|nr:MAG: HAD family hydrolase [Acidobacteriota bacterium]
MIETIHHVERAPVRSVLFDFDGTLSLIREGWQEVMINFMTEILWQLDPSQPEPAVRQHVNEYVTRLTGKQTIYQMIQLAEEIVRRGGVPEDPLLYKRQYHDRLWERIRERVKGLECGKYQAEQWLVTGSLQALEDLKTRGLDLFLASGTDEVFVRREAELLGLTRFFEGRIYGALDQYRLFSKKMIIQRVLSEQNLQGSELVAFGDGYVEIENTKEVGGTAVGVATDERLRGGRIDQWKRERLIAAGADFIVPDFSDHEKLMGYLTEG